MNILSIECTHAALSAAVKKDDLITELKSADWRKAAEALVPLIEAVMAKSALGSMIYLGLFSSGSLRISI